MAGSTDKERALLKAAKMYAAALQKSIEAPLPENTQAVIEAGRVVMLRCADLIPQDVLRKLSEVQRERTMKNG